MPDSVTGQTGISHYLRRIADLFFRPSDFFASSELSSRMAFPAAAVALLVAVYTGSTMGLQVDSYLSMNPQTVDNLKALGHSDESLQSLIRVVFWLVAVLAVSVVPLVIAGIAWTLGNSLRRTHRLDRCSSSIAFGDIALIVWYGEVVYWVLTAIQIPLMRLTSSVSAGFSLAVLGPWLEIAPESKLFLLMSKAGLPLGWEIVVVSCGLRQRLQLTGKQAFWLAFVSVGFFSILHVLFG